MSLLDGLLNSGVNLTPINTTLAAQQALITAQQSELEELRGDVDAATTSGAAQEAINTAQAAAIAAEQAATAATAALDATQAASIAAGEALNSAQSASIAANEALDATQGSAISTLQSAMSTAQSTIAATQAKVTELDRRRRMLDVRDYIPAGTALTGANVVAAIAAARDAAYLLNASVNEGDYSYDVYVPAGTYTIPSGTLPVFAGTGIEIVTPGLVGDGAARTVFVMTGMTTNQWALVCGSDGDGFPSYTYRQNLKGFSIIYPGEGGLGNGIDIKLSYYTWIEDVIVTGFNSPAQAVDRGYGLRMMRSNTDLFNHQHPRIKHCYFWKNVIGLRMHTCAQARLDDVGVQHNSWLGAVVEQCQGFLWDGANLQSGTTLEYPSQRWYNSDTTHMQCVVTGWSNTTGMPVGAGATMGVSVAGRCTVTGLAGMRVDTDPNSDRGRWLQVTATAPGSPDLVSGIYRIVSVPSATSCVIAKNTTHTAAAISYQVRGMFGALAGFGVNGGYDEGEKRATFVLGPEESGVLSTVSIRDGVFLNTALDAIRFGNLTVMGNHIQTFGGDRHIVCTEVSRLVTDLEYPLVQMDDFTRVGAVIGGDLDPLTSSSASMGAHGARYIGGRTQARDLHKLLKELGAVFHMSASRPDRAAYIAGTARIGTYTDIINGIVASPANVGVGPFHDLNDPEFGDAIVTPAALNAAMAVLTATIPAALLPSRLYSSTLFVVARKLAPGDTGLSTRSIEAADASGHRSLKIEARAGWESYRTTNTWPGAQDTTAFAGATADNTRPHVLIAGQAARRLPSSTMDETGVLTRSVAHARSWHNPGANVTIRIGAGAAADAGGIAIAEVAFIPRELSYPEWNALLDAANAKWPTLLRPKPTYEKQLTAPYPLTGVQQNDIPFGPFEIVAGRTYRYEMDLLVTNLTGASVTLALGAFHTVSGSPGVSTHVRTATRIGTTAAVSLEDATLSGTPGSVTLTASQHSIVLVRGLLVCSASGFINPRVQAGATGMSARAGSTFRMTALPTV